MVYPPSQFANGFQSQCWNSANQEKLEVIQIFAISLLHLSFIEVLKYYFLRCTLIFCLKSICRTGTYVWESLTETFCDFLSWSTAWRRWKRGGGAGSLFHSASLSWICILFSLFQIFSCQNESLMEAGVFLILSVSLSTFVISNFFQTILMLVCFKCDSIS